MALTEKQRKFIDSYLAQGNKIEACMYAGYSAKSAPAISCQLLKDPKIIAEITSIKAKAAKNALKNGLIPAKEFTKDDFIDYALRDYEAVEVQEPNRARMLQLAGQAKGFIGGTGQTQPQTINNLTQININSIESQPEAWELTRKLLGND